MQEINKILERGRKLATTFEPMTDREYEQFKVDGLNAAEGYENQSDGYNCDLCKNKSYIARLRELPNGKYTHYITDCKCAEIRRNIIRMKRSGLKNLITDYTFGKFEVTEEWQRTIKTAAETYAKNPAGWFFIGGQSGSGKSHICTAICREFLLAGREVVYMLWRDDISRLKAFAIEPDRRAEMIDRFKNAAVLYIDDLFKTGNNPDGSKQHPTSADVNAAFEILNFRYNNPNLITIVSSEWSSDELLDIDEATGGRIFERAGANGFSIAPDRCRNYRTRKAVKL